MNKTMLRPEYLNPGDQIAVVAPSGLVDHSKISEAIEVLKSWDLNVLEGENLYKNFGIFAGSDDERLSDLQWALDHKEIRAVFFARGGYGLSRIIERVDFSGFKDNPKWLAGFSDITLLHFYTGFRTGVPVIHSEMLLNIQKDSDSGKSAKTLKDLVFSGLNAFQWDCDRVVCGETSAEMAGGNLSMLCSIPGNDLKDYLEGKILFIEEVGEPLYRIDRMLLNLKHEGVFEGISGLLIGGMTDIPPSDTDFGYSLEEVVLNALGRDDIPVAFGFSAGHIQDNVAICFGLEYFFRVDSLSAVLAIS